MLLTAGAQAAVGLAAGQALGVVGGRIIVDYLTQHVEVVLEHLRIHGHRVLGVRRLRTTRRMVRTIRLVLARLVRHGGRLNGNDFYGFNSLVE